MEFEIVWSESALSHLEEINASIAQHNPTAAARIVREIQDRISLLATVPFMGPQYPHDPSGQIRTAVSGKYRIFYSVNESARRIEIRIIRHTSRRPLDASDFES